MNEIVTEARSWIGVRWKHQGRSRNGIDCAGLVIEVAKACRGSTFDKTDYPRRAYDETMLELCGQHMTRIPVAQAQPGDAMVFGLGESRHIGIVGDYLYGGLSLIHAYLFARKVVEMRLDDVWLSRARGCYRFPEAF